MDDDSTIYIDLTDAQAFVLLRELCLRDMRPSEFLAELLEGYIESDS